MVKKSSRVANNSGDMDMRTVMGWAIGVASIALLLLIMLILFGNLSGSVGFGNDGATIINETITVATTTGIWTINDNTNPNFVSWNATLILNATFGVSGPTNETLVEGVDYTIFSLNGTFGNLTSGNWNRSFVTYTTVRQSIGLINTDNFINNYTQSVLNTGEQFPTVGTIIGVGLLLFILIALLVFALGKMARMGGSSRGGSFG